MGRAILPELVIALFLLVCAGVVLVGISAAQWIAGAALVRRLREGGQRRAAQRKSQARRLARWEAHTDYTRGYAVIELRRVARWDGHELVVDSEDPLAAVILPEENVDAISRAQIEAELRARARNTTEEET